MPSSYDLSGPKRPVNLSLNAELVQAARRHSGNLSETVERLLAEYVAAAESREAEKQERINQAIRDINRYIDTYGSFADEHYNL